MPRRRGILRGDASCGRTREASAANRADTGAAEKMRKKKTERLRPSQKNVEELECQRMTHIAVERNRRKLMNDHLFSLRSLLPPSFVPRGDQASVVAGAIEYIKGLEQLVHFLRAEKRKRAAQRHDDASVSTDLPAGSSPFGDFFISPQYTAYTLTPPPSLSSSPSPTWSSEVIGKEEEQALERLREEEASDPRGGSPAMAADVEATVVHAHVNLKVLSRRRPGQLLRAIEALEEELHLTVLHLNVTTFGSTVLYSLNLKIEEECKLCSTDEIAGAMHQIVTDLMIVG